MSSAFIYITSLLNMSYLYKTFVQTNCTCRSQWPSSLRRGSATALLLGLRVRIARRSWIPVFWDYCVLSGRSLCDEPITHPEESYRLSYIVVCDLDISRMKRPCPASGCYVRKEIARIIINNYLLFCNISHKSIIICVISWNRCFVVNQR